MAAKLLRTRPAQLSNPPFPIRKEDATPDEVFILDGYWKSWRRSQYAGTTPHNWSMALAIETLQQLAARGAQFTIMDSPRIETLVGFICFEPSEKRDVLHYVFVKKKLRERGWGSELIAAAHLRDGFVYTHRTRDTQYILRDYYSSKLQRFRRHKPELARQAVVP